MPIRKPTSARWRYTHPLHCYFQFIHTQAQSSFPILESHGFFSLIKQCQTLRGLESIHAYIIRSRIHLSPFFSTSLLSQYASLGSISHAYTLFSTSRSFSDPFQWNAMIQAFSGAGDHHSSILLYRWMRDFGVPPNSFTFPFVLKACGCLHVPSVGIQVHADLVVHGWHSDTYVCNSLIAMYGKCRMPDRSGKVLEKMPQRNSVSHSSIIGAYAQNGRFEEGWVSFLQMLDQKLRPNQGSVSNAMACAHDESRADDIWRVVVDNELDFDQSVRNAGMQMYARCGRIDLARKLFDGILDKDLVSWTSMIEAYAQADYPWEALDLFKHMRLQGILPDSVSLLSITRAFANLASFMQARLIHGYITRCVLKCPVTLETSIVDLYVKCGSLEYARKVFDEMPEKNLFSWSAMISGYGMHGYGREALLLFDQMKASIKPDNIVFVSVLSACSHCGLISEGWECFNSMSREFELIPGPEHYACMVDLLGRAGKLYEAREFIKRMPIVPDVGVWGALLGACRIHSNVEMAELATKSLIELDAYNPGRYVLLSNIYASSGKRKEAKGVRDLMKRRGVQKTVGHTVIEIKNKLYTFVAGDESNPQTDLIYSELGKMMERIRIEGYMPDLNFVLHDVEEEMKEKLLYAHSEKLAIIFGLLNSGPGTPIRMTKNLRVCGDCHAATKFISKVTNREILVRDARRFHHFRSGSCSCKDYW